MYACADHYDFMGYTTRSIYMGHGSKAIEKRGNNRNDLNVITKSKTQKSRIVFSVYEGSYRIDRQKRWE